MAPERVAALALDEPAEPSWAGRFVRPFPDSRPDYWTGVDGGHEWSYADPCETWENAEAVYEARVETLLEQRGEMYDAWLEKLDAVYP